MTQLYEGMFLLDNQAVRADWAGAKSAVTDALAKHGAAVRTARRWDERRLAYPIKGRKRATYLLAYFEQEGTRSAALRRDLEIDERVLRYLILSVDELPEGELEKSQAELEAGFSVPPPPTDDEPQDASKDEASGSKDDSDDDSDSDADADGGGDDDDSGPDEESSEKAEKKGDEKKSDEKKSKEED